MPEQIQFEDAALALFQPINTKYAPNIEKVRVLAIAYMFDPERALENGRFIQVRFPNDEIGKDSGPEIDFTERFKVSSRVFDLINKTELKCLFMHSIEWYADYNPLPGRRLSQLFNLFESQKDLMEARGFKEMTALGIHEPSAKLILEYIQDLDPVNFISGCCALILISCIANLGNRALTN
jgi:hypothetical protein